MLNTVISLCSPASTCCPGVTVHDLGVTLQDACDPPIGVQRIKLTDDQLCRVIVEWATERVGKLPDRTTVVKLMGDLSDLVCKAIAP